MIRAPDPSTVRRHAVRERIVSCLEGVAHEPLTLVRGVALHRVQREQIGHSAECFRQILVRPAHARVRLVRPRIGRRRGKHELPKGRRARAGVLREQVVEERGPGAQNAHDEHRTRQGGGRDLGEGAKIALHSHASHQRADQVGAQGEQSGGGQPGFLAERAREDFERLARAVLGVRVRQAGDSFCGVRQRLRGELLEEPASNAILCRSGRAHLFVTPPWYRTHFALCRAKYTARKRKV